MDTQESKIMDRRAFLKTIAAGAVAAVVPLPALVNMRVGGFPAPPEPIQIVGTVTAIRSLCDGVKRPCFVNIPVS